jgi:hypothetical protein
MTATGYVSTTGDSRKVNKSGDTMSGDLVLNDSSPDTTNSATAKAYVDAADATKANAATQVIAGTGLTGGGTLAADRTLAVAYGTAAGTAAQGNDSRLSDARTPTPHAASHGSGGSDPVTVAQAQVTGLAAALALLLQLSGGTMTGDLNISGANLIVKRGDGTGAFRFRTTGGGLDLEIGGLDVTVSTFDNPDFSGTQHNLMRWESAGPHLIGKVQYGTSPFDDVHTIDSGTGVAALGAKNGLANIRLAGFKATSGAPSTGTWAAGDVVLDSAGAWHLCTTAGTPGVWS